MKHSPPSNICTASSGSAAGGSLSAVLGRHLFYQGFGPEYFWLWCQSDPEWPFQDSNLGGDKAMLWCPAVPPNCARRGHHSRNGPGAEWPL